MKENTFFETITLQGDGETIKYDITKPNRSDAVGKAYKRNTDGTYSLVGDDEKIDGIVLEVESDHKFTGAYLFGGLFFPIGDGETVARDQGIIGALGTGGAKGYVKGSSYPALSDLAAADIDTDAEKLAAYNAARRAITALSRNRGEVLDFDTTKALVAFAGR